jgi:tetratricopeptide (TPR) repeat protein
MVARTALGERYELGRLLGAGAGGVVHEALDRRSNTRLALKILSRTAPMDVYRFKHEFRALAELLHPNLLALYELESLRGEWFFTMELIPGCRHFLEHVRPLTDVSPEPVFEGDLLAFPSSNSATVVEGKAPATPRSPALLGGLWLDEEQLRAALPQLVLGVHALHEAGYLHRDIKPSNILVSETGRVVLADFGLVTALRNEPVRRKVEGRSMFGTVAFMSPEQAAGEPLDEASDWYGVGVVLFTALTGRLPFEGASKTIVEDKCTRLAPPVQAVNRAAPDDLAALCDALLATAPGDRPSASALLQRLGAGTLTGSSAPLSFVPASRGAREHVPGAPPFVGRAVERRGLHEAFASLRDGPVVAYVEGASGMGKSTLVRKFLAELGDSASVLSGRCREYESVAYKALDELLDMLAEQLAQRPAVATALRTSCAALARLFPVLGRLSGALRGEPVAAAPRDPQELRSRAAWALAELVRALCAERPLVMFLDDVQWGDHDSALLLGEALVSCEGAPLLVVCAYRSENAAQSAFLRSFDDARGQQHSPTRKVLLSPLTESEVRTLVEEVAPVEGVAPEAAAARLTREAAGSPMYVLELLRAGDRLEPGRARSLSALLGQRVAALPAAERNLLELLAVAGRPETLRFAGELCGPDASPAAERVLRGAHLVRRADPGDEGRLDVYHDRVREAVLEQLKPDRRRALHTALALAYERTRADATIRLLHWLGADRHDRARELAPLAAEQAAHALAFDHAASLYQRALELGVTHDAAGRSLRTLLAEALANAGRSAEAGAAYQDAARVERSEASVELRRKAMMQLFASGRIDEGVVILRQLARGVREAFPPTPLRALASLLWHRFRLWLGGARLARREKTSEVLRLRIDLCTSAGLGLGIVDPIRAADFQSRALLLALNAGDRPRAAKLLAYEAGHVAVAGSAGRARFEHLVRRASELARELDRPDIDAFLLVVRGVADYLCCLWPSALRYCEESELMLRTRCTGVAWELDMAHSFALWALYQLGELPELARRVPVLRQQAELRGNRFALNNLGFIMPFLHLVEGEPDAAQRACADALAVWPNTGFHLQHWNVLVMQTEVDIYCGLGGRAHQRLWDAMPAVRRSLLMRVQLLRSVRHQSMGRSALAAAHEKKRDPELLRAAERHARALEREPTPWGLGAAALISAGVAHQRGRHEPARAHLELAIQRYDAARMALYGASLRQRLGKLLGGDEGAALIADARRKLASLGVKTPERFIAMLAPGWD